MSIYFVYAVHPRDRSAGRGCTIPITRFVLVLRSVIGVPSLIHLGQFSSVNTIFSYTSELFNMSSFFFKIRDQLLVYLYTRGVLRNICKIIKLTGPGLYLCVRIMKLINKQCFKP
jgi:hypothetical protein